MLPPPAAFMEPAPLPAGGGAYLACLFAPSDREGDPNPYLVTVRHEGRFVLALCARTPATAWKLANELVELIERGDDDTT